MDTYLSQRLVKIRRLNSDFCYLLKKECRYQVKWTHTSCEWLVQSFHSSCYCLKKAYKYEVKWTHIQVNHLCKYSLIQISATYWRSTQKIPQEMDTHFYWLVKIQFSFMLLSTEESTQILISTCILTKSKT